MVRRLIDFVGQGDSSNPKEISQPDLLNDLLCALSVDSSSLFVFDLHEPWEIALGDAPISFTWTVMEGTVWVHRSEHDPIALNKGDTFLLPPGGKGRSRIVVTHSSTGPTHTPESSMDVFRRLQFSGPQPRGYLARSLRARWGGQGPMARVVSAAFGLNDSKLGPLFAALPELIVIRAAETGSDLVELLAHVAMDEEEVQQPGFSALAVQIAQLLLVHIVRTYALSTGSALGWLAGLGDHQIARALAAIHRDPAARWSVATLARKAGLSRSVFAVRFYAQVGQTAMSYLRAWRMHLAREALAGGEVTVSELSLDLGYQSEAAFRAVFRRATGLSPSEFRRIELRKHRLGVTI